MLCIGCIVHTRETGGKTYCPHVERPKDLSANNDLIVNAAGTAEDVRNDKSERNFAVLNVHGHYH
jgi:hypothetical protein